MAQIYIGMGSNIEPMHHVCAGLDALYRWLGPLAVSPVYRSPALGFVGEDFLNLVVGAQTSLSLTAVCQGLRQIEFAHGRPRDAKKFSSRTLDLDLLSFDDAVLTAPLELPRAEILHNAFVLRPFAELVPQWRHPVAGLTLAELWQGFAQDAILEPVALAWCGPSTQEHS
ncbi:MAG: 2-amino-4-hydroxy-6-hydroxymethyldihydropteridine diphosphokinase [Aeromonadaceae bacterium]|nr:2-amino-4-hydroxy-6-hydroxymethyldihydropteridine diphosphokinase [Aeromonadaceae bacterium]